MRESSDPPSTRNSPVRPAPRHQGLELPQLAREREAQVHRGGRGLAQPGELDLELLAEAAQHVDVEPHQRVELLQWRRGRLHHFVPGVGDVVRVGLHDVDQQVVLGAEHPVDGAGAHAGGLGDVPHGGRLEAAAAELGPGDGPQVGGAVAVLGAVPARDDGPGGLHGRRAVHDRFRRRLDGHAMQQHPALLGGKLLGVAAVEHPDADVQHALADPLGQQGEVDPGAQRRRRCARPAGSRPWRRRWPWVPGAPGRPAPRRPRWAARTV